MIKVYQNIPTEFNDRGFYVYKGYDKITNQLVYIGTTTQILKDRFRWHKYNGKDLKFEIEKKCDSEKEMLQLEFELILKYNPKLNKITDRLQNLNKKLTPLELLSRKNNPEWCQHCFKRRVKPGYKFCGYCF